MRTVKRSKRKEGDKKKKIRNTIIRFLVWLVWILTSIAISLVRGEHFFKDFCYIMYFIIIPPLCLPRLLLEGRHRQTKSYDNNMTNAEKEAYYKLSLREALEGLYNKDVEKSLQEVIKQNESKYPDLFKNNLII